MYIFAYRTYFVSVVYGFSVCLRNVEKCNVEALSRLLECFWKRLVMNSCELGLNAWFPGFSLDSGEIVKIDLFLKFFSDLLCEVKSSGFCPLPLYQKNNLYPGHFLAYFTSDSNFIIVYL